LRSRRDGAKPSERIAARRQRDHEGRQRKATPVNDPKATMSIEQTKPGSALDDQLRREQAKAIFDLLRSTSRPCPTEGRDR
jgi:hypothetical protein